MDGEDGRSGREVHYSTNSSSGAVIREVSYIAVKLRLGGNVLSLEKTDNGYVLNLDGISCEPPPNKLDVRRIFLSNKQGKRVDALLKSENNPEISIDGNLEIKVYSTGES